MRTQQAIAFLLGVIATLLGAIVFGNAPAPIQAQTVSSNGGYIAATANYFENGGRNMLWLVSFEKGSPHLCLYEAKEGNIALKYARNLTYDFMFDQYPSTQGSHTPSVKEVYDVTEKARKEARKEPAQGADKPK